MELYLSAPGSALHEGNADPVAHTVVGGETLQSIARATLGDSRLWYRIAQANGLSVQPDAPLQAGLTLSIPKSTLSANSAFTFKPYDPSSVIGDTNPALNALPQPQGGGGDDCGGFGQILLIAIAVAVTLITQGATSELVAEAVFESAAEVGATSATVSTTAHFGRKKCLEVKITEHIERFLLWFAPMSMYCGREFCTGEIETIKRLMEQDPSLLRTTLSRRLCQL